MKNTKTRRIMIIAPALIVAVVAFTIVKMRSNFTYIGTIEATKIDLPARLNTVVESKKVQEGEAVSKNQQLYILAGEEFRISADSAKRDFERAERLFKLGSLPREGFEHQKAKRDDAVLRWEWSTITAPIDGTILGTYKEIGEWVSPGMKLLTLANLNEVWAIFYLEESRLAGLRLNQKIIGSLVELDGKQFEGTLTWIGSEAEFTPKNVQTREERSRLVFPVKVTFSNPDHILKPGMNIEANL